MAKLLFTCLWLRCRRMLVFGIIFYSRIVRPWKISYLLFLEDRRSLPIRQKHVSKNKRSFTSRCVKKRTHHHIHDGDFACAHIITAAVHGTTQSKNIKISGQLKIKTKRVNYTNRDVSREDVRVRKSLWL